MCACEERLEQWLSADNIEVNREECYLSGRGMGFGRNGETWGFGCTGGASKKVH